MFDESLRKPINDAYESWVDRVSLMIETGQRDGSVDPALEPRATAETLTALMDGIGSRYMLGGLDDARAERLARAAIAKVLGDQPAA